MPTPFVLLTILVFLYTGIALITDMKAHRIPNWLTVSSLIVALVFHTVNDGWAGLGHALGGFGVGFGFIFVLWLIGGAGGGDVKLIGALGAWLGPTTTMVVLLITTPLALVLAVGYAVVRGAKTKAGNNEPKSLMKHGVPYAIPVAVSSWSILILKLLAPQ